MKKTTQNNNPGSTNFNITSKHLYQQLRSLIVQIIKAQHIEYGIPINPDSIEMCRSSLCAINNSLFSDSQNVEIKNYVKTIEKALKQDPKNKLLIDTYNVIKLLNLD